MLLVSGVLAVTPAEIGHEPGTLGIVDAVPDPDNAGGGKCLLDKRLRGSVRKAFFLSHRRNYE